MGEPHKSTDIHEIAGDRTGSQPSAGATRDFQSAPIERPVAANVQVPGYQMLGVLGRGGMGVVYKALQEKANRLVALKMILAGAHADSHDRTRFHVEAAAAARMSHPNIVQLYEVGETPDGFPFFSLEFVAGGTLAERLRLGPLGAHEAAALVEALARAMQYAHERGIVHRDLKPLNILLERGGGGRQQSGDDAATLKLDAGARTTTASLAGAPSIVPKISDFGLAKQLDSDDGLTHTGAIVGSPAYMAPEQAFGQSKNVGPAADIYALGAILYECLTGRPPFKGATIADTLEQVRTMEPLSVRAFAKEIPADLETICLHCLHKEPVRRYASAEALADDLRRYLEHKPISVRPVSTFERSWRWCRRNPAWAAMIGGLTLAVTVALVVTTTAYFTVSAQNELLAAEVLERKKQTDLANEKTVLAEARGEQSLKAVGLFATDARGYCEDAMVPGESRARLYGVLIKQLEQQADQASGAATLDTLRNKVFLYQTLCAVNLDFDDHRKSAEWFAKGIATVEQWDKLKPDDPLALGFRASLLTLRARSLNHYKKLEESRQLDSEALTLRRLIVGDPDIDVPAKADSIAQLADSLDRVERFEESIGLREKVCASLATSSKWHNDVFPYREALCWTYEKAGLHATEYEPRRKYLSQANALSAELHNERKSNRNVLVHWATIAKMLGELEYSHGKLAEQTGNADRAEKHFSAARKHYEVLNSVSRKLATSTDLMEGLREYARSFYTLGLVEQRNGNATAARNHFELSRLIRAQTLRDYAGHPNESNLLIDLWFSQVALGEVESVTEKANLMAFVLRMEPTSAYRMACLYALAITAIEQQHAPAPLTANDKRLQNLCRQEAIRCLQHAHDGGFTDFFQSSIDSDLAAIRADPHMKEFEASHHYQLGVLEKTRGHADKSRLHFEKSRDLAEQGIKALKRDARLVHLQLARLGALVQLGQHAMAVSDADKIRPRDDSAARFRLARVYAQASALTDDVKQRQHCVDSAIAALEQASKVATEARLIAEVDLDPLRDDSRFKAILQRAKKK